MTENTTPDNATANSDSETVDFDALAMLAGLQGATGDQIALLKIITDPSNSDGRIEGATHMEIADSYEEDFSGYMGFDYNSELQTVADFLYTHHAGLHAADETAPEFSFGFDCNADGEIGGYTVSASFGTDWKNRITLASFHDIKHSTTDREATGLKAALAIAEMLDSDHRAVVAKARMRGLIAADPNLIENATRALADYDAVPAEEDIDVDTLAGVRDALASLLAAQGVQGTSTDG